MRVQWSSQSPDLSVEGVESPGLTKNLKRSREDLGGRVGQNSRDSVCEPGQDQETCVCADDDW